MTADTTALLASAHRRARALATARDRRLRDALIRRVLFDLRAALSNRFTTTRKPLR